MPNQLTTCNRVLPEKLIVNQLVSNVPPFYGTQRFITVLISIPPLRHILSQLVPVHILTPYFSTIHFNNVPIYNLVSKMTFFLDVYQPKCMHFSSPSCVLHVHIFHLHLPPCKFLFFQTYVYLMYFSFFIHNTYIIG